MKQNITKTSTVIRGGQTTQHWFRMGVQVLRFSSVVAATLYVIVFLGLVAWNFDFHDMRTAFYYELAERGITDDNGFNKPYTLRYADGTTETLDALTLYRSTEHRLTRDGFFQRIDYASYAAIMPALVFGIISLFVFQITGNKIQDNDFVRGARLVTARELTRWSNLQWKSYHKRHKGRKTTKPLTIAGIPFPPNSAEAQTGLYGTVGVGKTNAMAEMLSTIRANGGKAIVYDRMGSFVSKFYDPETDVILNPFDSRSVSWNVFDDVLDAASFTQIAEVMIPEKSGASADPFWQQSARIVFDYAARSLHKQGNATISELVKYVLELPAEQLSDLIKSTPGRHFFSEGIEKTSQSIRANLISELRFLEFLRDDGDRFSIRDWVASDDPSILFLTGDAEHAAATRNIISAVLEISANAYMSRGPSAEPRCYVFMDEVPSLNRLPFLVSSLAEIRQFGVCYILGYQVYSQLEDIYGRDAAQSINGNTNNRVIFSTPDHRTAKLCSESLGSEDLIEKTSNISVGAHEARDGVGFQQTRVERALVTTSEIQVLPQFAAYIKFAYNAPLARVDFDVFAFDDQHPAFLPYMGKAPGFDAGRATPPKKPSPSTPDAPITNDELYDDFIKWCGLKFGVNNAPWMKERTMPPLDLQPYWDCFAQQRRAGLAVEHIQDIVVMTEGLMGSSKTHIEQEIPRLPTHLELVVNRTEADLPKLDFNEPQKDAPAPAEQDAQQTLPLPEPSQFFRQDLAPNANLDL